MVKAKQLELAPRSQLPNLIAELNVAAPEMASSREALRLFEEEKIKVLASAGAGSAEMTALQESIDKARFRLELAAEEARSRLIRESRELNSKVEALRRQRGDPASGTPLGQPNVR